jgi:hypothetical protein
LKHLRKPLKTILLLSFGEELKVRPPKECAFLEVPLINYSFFIIRAYPIR